MDRHALELHSAAFEHHSSRTLALSQRALSLAERCAELRSRQMHLLATLRTSLAELQLRRAAPPGASLTLSALPGAADAPPRPAAPAAESPAPGMDLARYRLTRREREVATLLAGGFSNAAVAEMLRISEHTARHHTESVLAKLGVRSRAEAGAFVRGWYGAPPRPPQLRRA